MFDAAFWYYKTQYRKRRWLEMLYRKDDPFGRALLFSAMRRMILRPRYHAACRAEKRIASYCIYAKAVETGERYIALHGRYEK